MTISLSASFSNESAILFQISLLFFKLVFYFLFISLLFFLFCYLQYSSWRTSWSSGLTQKHGIISWKTFNDFFFLSPKYFISNGYLVWDRCIWFEGARRCSWHGMWPADERTPNLYFSCSDDDRRALFEALFSRLSSEKCNLRNSQAEDFLQE